MSVFSQGSRLTSSEPLTTLIRRSQALQTGHFQLASGLHASRFFRAILLLQDPIAADPLFDRLAERFCGEGVDLVLGANAAGSILAFEVARRLGCSILIAQEQEQRYRLMEGFAISQGCRVLVVDDVTTTGGTAKQLLGLVRSAQGIPVGVGLIATKGLFQVDLGCRTEVLLPLEGMDAYPAQDCPLCQQGIPLTR
ncbi:MAG: phosphoribosyltransferase family protein [Cyanobacteriota bacterium]|nr:phosphoribosyltransferase family protein [Cyanobacteriota bacterium]